MQLKHYFDGMMSYEVTMHQLPLKLALLENKSNNDDIQHPSLSATPSCNRRGKHTHEMIQNAKSI